MLKTYLTEKCLDIAKMAHMGQVQKDGITPYIEHPIAVAERMFYEKDICVALLHDVLEDSDFTAYDLMLAGVPTEYIRIVALLTHDKKEPYSTYIERCGTDITACRVKIADLVHNMDTSRLPQEKQGWLQERIDQKYMPAYNYLRNERLPQLQAEQRGEYR